MRTNFRRPKNRTVEHQLSNWSKRRVASWSLFALAAGIAAQHLVAHSGFRPIPISMGWQDLLLGYPMAIVVAIAGGIALDPNPRI